MRYVNNGRGLHPRHGTVDGTRFFYIEGATPQNTMVSFGQPVSSTQTFKTHSGSATIGTGLVGSMISLESDVMKADGWSEMVSAFQSGNFTFSCTFRLRSFADEGLREVIASYWGDNALSTSAEKGLFAFAVNENGKLAVTWDDSSGSIGWQDASVRFKAYQWYNVTFIGKGNGVSTDLEIYVNGSLIDTLTGLNRADGGADATLNIGGLKDGGTGALESHVDICGVYLIPDVSSDEWIKEAGRRAFSLDTLGCISTKIEIESTFQTVDLSDFEGHNWIKSGTIEEDIDNDLSVADIELFKNADRKSLSPLNETSDLNNNTFGNLFEEILRPSHQVRVYFARHSKADEPQPDDWMLRFEGKIDSVDFSPVDSVKISCVDKAGDLLKANITGFEKNDGSEVLMPEYGIRFFDENGVQLFDPDTDSGDTSKTVTHQEAIQQILNDHDNQEETGIVSKLQAIEGESTREAILYSYDPVTLDDDSEGGEDGIAFIKRRPFEGQPILTAVNSIALEVGRRVVYRWNNQQEQFNLTYYEPQREGTPVGISLNPLNVQDMSSGLLSIENVRNDIRITFPLNDTIVEPTASGFHTEYPEYDWEVFGYAQTSPDEPSTGFVRVSSESSMQTYGRLFMQTGDSLTPGISNQKEAERLALSAIQDLAEADILINLETINTFEVEIDDYVQVEPDQIEISTAQKLAVKSTVISFSKDGVSQSLTMFGKPSVGAGRILSFEVLPGLAIQPLINPTLPFVNIPTQNALNNLQLNLETQILSGVTTLPTAAIIGDGQTTPLQVVLSADSGNTVIYGSDGGLYIPSGSATVNTTDSVDGDGSPGDPLAVNISSDVGNNITIGSDGGIFNNTVGLTVSTDNSIDGDGSGGDPLSVNVSSDAGNSVVLGSDGGIFVDEISSDTDDTINGDGTALSPLSVNISGDAGNRLSLGSDGGLFSEDVDGDKIEDNDGDTKVEVERSADDDTVRVVAKGKDILTGNDGSLTSVQTNTGAGQSSTLSQVPNGLFFVTNDSLNSNYMFVLPSGVNLGTGAITMPGLTSLSDAATSSTALVSDSGTVKNREIAPERIVDGVVQAKADSGVFGGSFAVKLDNTTGTTEFAVSNSLGVTIVDSVLPQETSSSGVRRSRIFRDGNSALTRYPISRMFNRGSTGSTAPSDAAQLSDELIVHSVSSDLVYSLTLTGVSTGDFVRIANRATSTANVIVDGNSILPGTFLDFQYDGNTWIVEMDTDTGTEGGGPYTVSLDTPTAGDITVDDITSGNSFIIPASALSGGGGGGPYNVSIDTPTAGDVTVTDTASGNSFVIDESSFTQGNAALQSQITANALNISSNDSDISDLQAEDVNLQSQIDAIVSSGGGGGPYTVELNTPTAGDVRVTDTASANTFVIPESAFEYGHSALQSQITTNAGNISTNTSSISSNTSSISINAGNISTNTSNIATNASDIVTNREFIDWFIDAKAKKSRAIVDTSQIAGTALFTIGGVSAQKAALAFPWVDYDVPGDFTLQESVGSAPSDSNGGSYYTAPLYGYYRYDIRYVFSDLFDSSAVSIKFEHGDIIARLMKNATYSRTTIPPLAGDPVYDKYVYSLGTGTELDSANVYSSLNTDGTNSTLTGHLSMTGTVFLSAGDVITVLAESNADRLALWGNGSKYGDVLYGAKFEIMCVQIEE